MGAMREINKYLDSDVLKLENHSESATAQKEWLIEKIELIALLLMN